MNVRDELLKLAEKIHNIYPKITPEISQDVIKKSIISDIQSRLAEIYAIIMREISNEDLDLDYATAIEKFPDRMESILKTFSVLALATKTKLNINNFQKVFDQSYIKKIDDVVLECYKFNLTLSEKTDATANQTYNKGIVVRLEYDDYKTGFKKNFAPGLIQGQIQSFYASTPQEMTNRLSMVTQAREQLDQNFKVPLVDERILLTLSNTTKIPAILKEYRQPKSLLQTTVNYLLKNRLHFFKNLEILPSNIVEKFSDLDSNYQRKFVNKAKKIIMNNSFKPESVETKYLRLIAEALQDKKPYNAVRHALEEIDSFTKKAFLSTAKQNLQPIRNEIVNLMKDYLADQKEYVKIMGKKI